MFSGKSTELIRRLKRYQIARYECLIIKYSKDTRYDEKNIATHDRQTLKASMCAADKLSDLRKKAMEYDVIGIDEGQFVSSIVGLSIPFCSLLLPWQNTSNEPSFLRSSPTLLHSARRCQMPARP